jgi:WD40 repeat protein
VSRRQHFVAFLFLLAFAASRPAQSEPPAVAEERAPAPEAARADADGDALPRGAFARLGTLRWRHHLGGHTVIVTMSSDGRFVAGAGESSGLGLWETASGKTPRWFHPDLSVKAALFVPGRNILLTAGGERDRGGSRDIHWVIRHREVGTGDTRKQVEFTATGEAFTNFPRFSADGGFFVSQEDNRRVGLWDVNTGERYAEVWVEDDLEFGYPVAVSPDGKTLALVSRDGRISVRELPEGKERCKLPAISDNPWEHHFFPVFSPDGRTLVTAGPESLFFWDAAEGRLRREVGGGWERVAFSADGKYLVCAGDEIRLLDATTFKEIRRFEKDGAYAYALSLSADGRRLVTGTASGVGLWDTATGRRLNAGPGHQLSVTRLAFAPDGGSLVSGGTDGVVCVWDLTTRRPRYTFPGHFNEVTSLAVSPDGATLATGEGGGCICLEAQLRLWDLRRGRLLRQFTGHLNGICDLAFSPDGQSLASAGHDARFRVWDVATGRRRFQVRGTDHHLRRVAFSPDGRTVAASGSEGELGLWDARDGTKLRDLGPQGKDKREIGLIAFVRGGQAVLACEADRGREEPRCSFWGVEGGERLKSVGAPRERYLWFRQALSPDGTLLAARDEEAPDAIQLWDVETGRRLACLSAPGEDVTALAFSADGKTLASGTEKATILLWDVVQARLDGLWAELGESDIPAERFAPIAGDAVPLLKARLVEAAAVEEKVRPLLPGLDDDSFDVRERATADLAKLGPPAEPALREALEASRSAEVRRRLEDVLKEIGGLPQGPDEARRRIRWMIKALETIDTAEARQAIRDLARGDAALTVTRLAREAAGRLGRFEHPR